jgi:hypothetical protein
MVRTQISLIGLCSLMTAQNITSLFLRPRTFSAGALRDAASSAEGRHGDFALAAGHRLNAIGSLTGRSSSGTRCLRLIGSTSRSAPAARRRWRDADLDPAAAPTGSIRAIDLLRNDTRGTDPTTMREHHSEAFVEKDARLGVTQ